MPQALAAHQAGCLYVAPYFNELRVHFEPNLWKKYDDTAREHPMASVIHDIVATYKSIGAKTLVMPASIVTGEEVRGSIETALSYANIDQVVALASLQPDHLTLSGSVLDLLAALPNNPLPEPLSLPAGLLSSPCLIGHLLTQWVSCSLFLDDDGLPCFRRAGARPSNRERCGDKQEARRRLAYFWRYGREAEGPHPHATPRLAIRTDWGDVPM